MKRTHFTHKLNLTLFDKLSIVMGVYLGFASGLRKAAKLSPFNISETPCYALIFKSLVTSIYILCKLLL